MDKVDYFVSYNHNDKSWAEWIAWTLESAGYSTLIQAWDFQPGGNFVLDMQRAAERADKLVAVLSPNYLSAQFTQSEWTSIFVKDPQGLERRLIPVMVKACRPPGLLAAITHIRLFDLSEDDARTVLLSSLKEARLKPATNPAFPNG